MQCQMGRIFPLVSSGRPPRWTFLEYLQRKVLKDVVIRSPDHVNRQVHLKAPDALSLTPAFLLPYIQI